MIHPKISHAMTLLCLLLLPLAQAKSQTKIGTRGGGGIEAMISYIAEHSDDFYLEKTYRTSKYKVDFCVAAKSGLEGLRIIHGYTQSNDGDIIGRIFHKKVTQFITADRANLIKQRLAVATQIHSDFPLVPKALEEKLLARLENIWQHICIGEQWTFQATASNENLKDPITGLPVIYLNDPAKKIFYFDPNRLAWAKNQKNFNLAQQIKGADHSGSQLQFSYWQLMRALGLHELLSVEGAEKENYELSSFYLSTHKASCSFLNIVVGNASSGQEGLRSQLYRGINGIPAKQQLCLEASDRVSKHCPEPKGMVPEHYRYFACHNPPVGRHHLSFRDGTSFWKWNFLSQHLEILSKDLSK